MKRNDLKLPSIDVYNIVLKSILNRSLNSELTLDSIEGKLTVLLTVYQDILAAGIKPNKETYNIVVTALLKGSLQCLDIPTDNIYNTMKSMVNLKNLPKFVLNCSLQFLVNWISTSITCRFTQIII